MNIEHKPGVLCLIIGARTEHGRKHIGKTVTLVKHLSENEFGEHLGERFRCATGYGDYWIVVGDVQSLNGRPGVAAIAQSHLMPIKDPDQDFVEDHKYKVVVTVNGVPVESYAPDEETRLCI